MNEKELVLAGIDVKDMLERFMNNTTLIRIVVGKFVADGTYQQLKDAIAAGDMKAAEFSCHSLKGVCGNMSLKKLFAMLQEQLQLFRSGEYDRAVAMMDEISGDYETAIAHLKLWLAQ